SIFSRAVSYFWDLGKSKVEEIESVLENAFQAAALIKPSPPSSNPPKLPSKHFSTPIAIHSQRQISAIPTTTPSSTSNIPSGIEQCKLHITSSVLLNRLFGRSRTDIDSNNKENTTAATPSAPNKQRRRPVSAVFSQALHRLSSASIYNKRHIKDGSYSDYSEINKKDDNNDNIMDNSARIKAMIILAIIMIMIFSFNNAQSVFSSTDTPRKLERPVSICQPSSSTPIATKAHDRRSANLQYVSTPQVFTLMIIPIKHLIGFFLIKKKKEKFVPQIQFLQTL
uniref:Uncharacterized protein n=1 Tax=Elaeophora elaphi TaxID=1147741 RepID=A0A0R3RM02_9BILA